MSDWIQRAERDRTIQSRNRQIASGEDSQSPEHNLKMLQRHRPHFVVWPFEEQAAKEFGRVAAELIRRGRKMQQIDMQIAAIALSLGDCVVVSKDADLRAVPGLEVEDWSR